MRPTLSRHWSLGAARGPLDTLLSNTLVLQEQVGVHSGLVGVVADLMERDELVGELVGLDVHGGHLCVRLGEADGVIREVAL